MPPHTHDGDSLNHTPSPATPIAQRPENLDIARCLGLSERETEVFLLVIDGVTDGAIAAKLGIAESTVRTHLNRVFKKTGRDGRVALISHWYETLLQMLLQESPDQPPPDSPPDGVSSK